MTQRTAPKDKFMPQIQHGRARTWHELVPAPSESEITVNNPVNELALFYIEDKVIVHQEKKSRITMIQPLGLKKFESHITR